MTAPLERARRALIYGVWGGKALLTQPRLTREIWQFERTLPARMATHTLPDLMAELTTASPDLNVASDSVREISDSVAAFDVGSPLGICLRRSLVRYYFLRRAGLPVEIRFGARFQESHDIGGHAWLVLNDQPYYEASENYQGFVVMYQYPK